MDAIAHTLVQVEREPEYPVTEHLVDLIETDRKELGWSKSELCRRAGIERQLLNELLKCSKRSAAVPKILKALGRPLHHAYPLTKLQREILDALEQVLSSAGEGGGKEFLRSSRLIAKGLDSSHE